MAAISKPLTNLTKKDSKEFVWTQACEEAFKEIKQLLTMAPLLLGERLCTMDRCQ